MQLPVCRRSESFLVPTHGAAARTALPRRCPRFQSMRRDEGAGVDRWQRYLIKGCCQESRCNFRRSPSEAALAFGSWRSLSMDSRLCACIYRGKFVISHCFVPGSQLPSRLSRVSNRLVQAHSPAQSLTCTRIWKVGWKRRKKL